MVGGCLGKGVTGDVVIPATLGDGIVAFESHAMDVATTDTAPVGFGAHGAWMFGRYAVPVSVHFRAVRGFIYILLS